MRGFLFSRPLIPVISIYTLGYEDAPSLEVGDSEKSIKSTTTKIIPETERPRRNDEDAPFSEEGDSEKGIIINPSVDSYVHTE